MNKKRFLLLAVLALQAVLVPSAQSQEKSPGPSGASSHPFAKYQRFGYHIYVTDPAHFQPDSVAVDRQGDQARDVQRGRFGKVALSPSVQVVVERATAQTHGPSFIELYEVKSQKLVGSFDLGLVSPGSEDGALLFTGQGVVYWHHSLPYLCAGKATKKFLLSGASLKEVPQPFLSMHASARTTAAVKLFSGPAKSSPVLAELPNESAVEVIGVASDSDDPSLKGKYPGDPAMLVRTPFGLVGWHVAPRSGGSLTITACN